MANNVLRNDKIAPHFVTLSQDPEDLPGFNYLGTPEWDAGHDQVVYFIVVMRLGSYCFLNHFYVIIFVKHLDLGSHINFLK